MIKGFSAEELQNYMEKANDRSGGVGTETTVISAEVYGNAEQEKFIPIVMERDESGKEYLPAYLKGRMYKDLTGDNFEKGYESLLRTLYKAPAFRKPEIGSRPAWLEDTPQEVIRVKQAALRLSGKTANKKLAVQEFIDFYIESMKPYYRNEYRIYDEDGVKKFEFLELLDRTLEQRNILLDFAKEIVLNTDTPGDYFADIMERVYNALNDVHTFKPGATSCYPRSFDFFKYQCWELFICLMALLLHYEKYSDIRAMLVRTYFLIEDELEAIPQAHTYLFFYSHNETIERIIKPKTNQSNLYTMSGEILCHNRQYAPIFTTTFLARADLFLYQIYPALELPDLEYYTYWFPICYVYGRYDREWTKLTSKRYCEKLFTLLDVNDMKEFKDKIAKCIPDKEMKYSSGFVEIAPAIMSYINESDIGMYP